MVNIEGDARAFIMQVVICVCNLLLTILAVCVCDCECVCVWCELSLLSSLIKINLMIEVVLA